MNPTNKILETNRIKLAVKIGLRMIFIFAFLGLMFFLPAGTFYYWEAWAYCFTLIIPASIIIIYFIIKDPELIERRILKRKEKEEEQKTIQKVFSIVFLIGLLFPGLDFRYQWSDVPLVVVGVANLFVLFGYAIIIRVMVENRYATAIIETSDEQRVIETGPYRIVRHPMYTGGLILMLFTPLALGSYWAVIPFFIGTVLGIIFRILTEEKFLIAHLPGYKEYCQKTKYRLIPYIW